MDASQITYQRLDRSVSFTQANLGALLFGLPLALLFILAHILIHQSLVLMASWELLGAFVIGVIVHEGLHAAGWMIAGNLPLSAITFGFSIKGLAPYAHAKQPLPINAYRFGTALPCVALGIVPSLIGIIGNWPMITGFGAVMTLAAGGDLLILWMLRRDPATALVADHPDRAGCEVWLPASNS
ncbi:MAG: DUF3267 domain-containing protein [Chloroflexus sp.]